MIQTGDRVTENGRVGTVVALHTKGTYDVLFDGAEYAIRRQERSIQKMLSNPRRKKSKRKGLTKASRARLKASSFVFPRTRRYPINDLYHGQLALQYAQWPNNRKDLKKVKAAVFKKYPSLIKWWNKNHPEDEWTKGKSSSRRAGAGRGRRRIAANPRFNYYARREYLRHLGYKRSEHVPTDEIDALGGRIYELERSLSGERRERLTEEDRRHFTREYRQLKDELKGLGFKLYRGEVVPLDADKSPPSRSNPSDEVEALGRRMKWKERKVDDLGMLRYFGDTRTHEYELDHRTISDFAHLVRDYVIDPDHHPVDPKRQRAWIRGDVDVSKAPIRQGEDGKKYYMVWTVNEVGLPQDSLSPHGRSMDEIGTFVTLEEAKKFAESRWNQFHYHAKGMGTNYPRKENPRSNPSRRRKSLRAKYRKKHGDNWWKKKAIYARFRKELKR